jgi:hypothetical protein
MMSVLHFTKSNTETVDVQTADHSGHAVLRCPHTYESGSRVRLGELDSVAGLGHISPHTHERTPNFARTFQYPE